MKHEDYSLAWVLACTKDTVGGKHLRAGRLVENYFYALLTSPEDVVPLSEFEMEKFLRQQLGLQVEDEHREGAQIVFDHFVSHCVDNQIPVNLK